MAYVPEGNEELPRAAHTRFSDRVAAYANLCQLAAEGYIVARMDPPGPSLMSTISRWPPCPSTGLDPHESDFSDGVDIDLIGTMGHSLGGKVALMNAIEIRIWRLATTRWMVI